MKARQTGVYVAVIALAVIFLILAFTITPLSEITISSDSAYPILVAVLCTIFAIWIVVSEEKKRKNSNAKASEESTADGDNHNAESEHKIFSTDVLVTMGMIALYGILLLLAGYIIATLIFTAGAVTYLYKRDFKTGLLVGFISTFIIVLIFKYGFSVILP